MTELYELCLAGKLDEVKLALTQGGDVNNKNELGQTALMAAVRMGHNSIVQVLLYHPQIEINELDSLGGSALHFAAWANNHEAARMLLLHPGMGSANSMTNNGNTAVMRAIMRKNKEVLRELVSHSHIILDVGDLEGDER